MKVVGVNVGSIMTSFPYSTLFIMIPFFRSSRWICIILTPNSQSRVLTLFKAFENLANRKLTSTQFIAGGPKSTSTQFIAGRATHGTFIPIFLWWDFACYRFYKLPHPENILVSISRVSLAFPTFLRHLTSWFQGRLGCGYWTVICMCSTYVALLSSFTKLMVFIYNKFDWSCTFCENRVGEEV
jgi:hypothetical protein